MPLFLHLAVCFLSRSFMGLAVSKFSAREASSQDAGIDPPTEGARNGDSVEWKEIELHVHQVSLYRAIMSCPLRRIVPRLWKSAGYLLSYPMSPLVLSDCKGVSEKLAPSWQCRWSCTFITQCIT